MRVLGEITYEGYLFECEACHKLIAGKPEEFDFIVPGILGVICPNCGNPIYVLDQELTEYVVYAEEVVTKNQEGS